MNLRTIVRCGSGAVIDQIQIDPNIHFPRCSPTLYCCIVLYEVCTLYSLLWAAVSKLNSERILNYAAGSGAPRSTLVSLVMAWNTGYCL